MYQHKIKKSTHDWAKVNLVTKTRRGRAFDEMVCSNCGMKGRRYDFANVTISGNYKQENVDFCPEAEPFDVPKSVKVTHCFAHGRQFENMKPGSVHEVVTPPDGYKNDHTGVWVMGVGEPIKLLTEEYETESEYIFGDDDERN